MVETFAFGVRVMTRGGVTHSSVDMGILRERSLMGPMDITVL